MIDDRFGRVLVSFSIEMKDGFGTLYMRDATELLRKQVEFFGKDDTTFCTGRGNALSRATIPNKITNYIRACNKGVKKKVTTSRSSGEV